MGDCFVVTASAVAQPTWPTQPSIPLGLVNVIVGYGDNRLKAYDERCGLPPTLPSAPSR